MAEKEIKELIPYVCDVCGDQATQSAINYFMRRNIDLGVREHIRAGDPKYGCVEHLVYSDEIDLGWNFNPFTGERHEDW